MNLVRLGSLKSELSVFTDKNGRVCLLAVAKGTFAVQLDGTRMLAEEQQEIVYADEFHGEPGISSVKYESDFAFYKPRTDVIVLGHAYVTGGNTARRVDVTLELSTIRKTVRVWGDRVWRRTLFGRLRPSRPQPFERLPLIYERAYGGTDTSHKNEKKHRFELRNLFGVGFHARRRAGICGTPVPNLEDPQRPITRPLKKGTVAGFGFLARNSEPRISFAGTYDERWMNEQYPFLPEDFDDHYFQAAPSDQTCEHIRGGELAVLRNLTPEGVWQFRLPNISVPVKVKYRSGEVDIQSALDTVIIEPDLRRCILVRRASHVLQGKLADVIEVWVGNADLEAPKTMTEAAEDLAVG